MNLPDPVPGLVIRFGYTWHKDRFRKDRPCAIVLTSQESGLVTVVPITHSYPEVGEEDQSILIPEDICKAIGLDQEANYVRVSEINQFVWPSDRLAPLPHDQTRCDYGMVPESFFLEIRKKLAAIARAKRMKALKVD
ncbi:hypothetical protein [Agrobacterium vitis]|uniref:hypothetical protein n=1 Tax=Agrobacterium vitis TaxID=373 RepID=UPI001F1A2AED|nr:hypothetical protein [Agrobacterium vitis]